MIDSIIIRYEWSQVSVEIHVRTLLRPVTQENHCHKLREIFFRRVHSMHQK